MSFRGRRFILLIVLTAAGLLYLWHSGDYQPAHVAYKQSQPEWPVPDSSWRTTDDKDYLWNTVVVNYPVPTFRPLPESAPNIFPPVQATFPQEAAAKRDERLRHQQAVKDAFTRCWASYKKNAWMADELEPVSGGKKNPFGGWAATLVDSLDTLLIMGMYEEFNEAVTAAEGIDFTRTDLEEVNVFETTIRYLGGFLAAYELSNDARLLRKAVQVGEMIYKAFDTPNHMPITRWDIHAAAKGEKQAASSEVLVAEIGSLCMELTRLSQLTGDPKWFDAAQAITEVLDAQQDSTELPGLWPLVVDAKEKVFNKGSTFTLGAMADSTYEYLPKMAAMTGGQLPAYQRMYEKAVNAASKHNLFRPMTPTNEDILVAGQVHTRVDKGKPAVDLEPQGQHLVCFLGGVLALGSKLFSRKQDLELAAKLTSGCVYAYKAFPHGIMPETFYVAPCDSTASCEWDEEKWKKEVRRKGDGSDRPAEDIIAEKRLPKGFTHIPDKRYTLRPEAIESVFVLYRVTARRDLLDSAWDMFSAIEDATRTDLANTALRDVTVPGQKPTGSDSMESFWMGETLKYFYLIFSEPELISLDEYVFNTEAHPLRRLG